MMRYLLKWHLMIPRRWGSFFPKVTENGTEEYGPFNDNHVITYGVLYCDELKFKSEFLELNCCSSHTGYFLKIWRLLGGADGVFCFFRMVNEYGCMFLFPGFYSENKDSTTSVSQND